MCFNHLWHLAAVGKLTTFFLYYILPIGVSVVIKVVFRSKLRQHQQVAQGLKYPRRQWMD